jgi:hypothetical protein
VTRAVIICNFTLTLVIPNTRQLVYIALKTLFADANLAIKMVSGLIELFAIYNPKYLKFYTVSIYYEFTYIY